LPRITGATCLTVTPPVLNEGVAQERKERMTVKTLASASEVFNLLFIISKGQTEYIYYSKRL
jgi:hypothetical protein